MKIRPRSDAPDLHSQYESLLDQVWRSEADWRLWDRLDATVMLDDLRRKRRRLPDASHARDSEEAA
jgi:hypothetical protein